MNVLKEIRMESLGIRSLLKKVCFLDKKWGLFLSFQSEIDLKEILVEVPFLEELMRNHESNEIYNGIDGGWFALFFDSEEELYEKYEQVKDSCDNPKGEISVYALTCNNEGEWETENT